MGERIVRRGDIWANCIAFYGGAILLSIALGWEIGVGIALLVYFLKGQEQ